MTDSVLFARQPILSRQKEIVGYELLFRDNANDNNANIDQQFAASAKVMLSSLTGIDVRDVINQKRAFINMPLELLDEVPRIAQDRWVIEVLESADYSADTLSKLKRLKQHGFLIALDDFDYRLDNSTAITFADFIKIDIKKYDDQSIKTLMDKVKNQDVNFVAFKVESGKDFRRAYDLGFSYFQGYFFSHPEIITGHAIKPGKQSVLQLIQELNDPDTEFDKLLPVIARDSVLSYTLLKLINSSMYRRATEITSLHHALVLLGAEKIRSWGNLLLMSRLPDGNNALLVLALIRALMSEQIALELKISDEKAAFTTGLFSCLEAFTHKPMSELLENLNLSQQVKEALLKREGDLGQIIKAIEAHEYGDWDNIDSNLINTELLAKTYQIAINEADNIEKLFIQQSK